MRRHFAIAAAAIRRRRHFDDAAFADFFTLMIFRLFHIDAAIIFRHFAIIAFVAASAELPFAMLIFRPLQAAAAAELTFSPMPLFIAATDIFDIFTPLFFLFIFSLVIFAFIYD
jgi:hypothetical protein